MAEIKPFRGYAYNKEKIKDISTVIAPPWDVIDEEAEKRLRALSPWNIINLISGGADPERAKELFEAWIGQNILVREEEERFYFGRHRFSWQGKHFVRKGVFALIRLEDFGAGSVIPHEEVFEKHHANRYRLIEKCRANFSPVFMLYRDESRTMEKIIEVSVPDAEGMIGDGDSFAFGRIEGEGNTSTVKELLSRGKLIIADGHHRYQAALRYYKDNPAPENGFVLVFLVNIESPELLIMPTHRYVTHDVSFAGNKSLFEKHFDVEGVSSRGAMFEKMQKEERAGIFGVYEKGEFYIIKLKNLGDIRKYAGGDFSDRRLSLDTVILHSFVIDEILKPCADGVFYHQSPGYLLNEYDRRKTGVIFFLNPVGKKQFADICLNGELMPQKTTYFYPKVPSGFVINRFE
ncbi:MAG: DUF1015 domain-containing protein [Candidatus Omnitrophica bacterium]|nr:DUF1015 domain-containing protein [Candidatus Omnitrophota bacterium]